MWRSKMTIDDRATTATTTITTSTITTIITATLMVLVQKVDAKTLTSTRLLLTLQHGTCQKSNT